MLERADFSEQVGVDSNAAAELLKYLESKNMRTDSIEIIRHGKVACECHWTPNDPCVPHDVFSMSKTIVATAIGIAVDEGIISLDTKIYPTYFPQKLEKLKGKQKKWAEMVTIHHVISMRMGKVTSVFDDKAKTDWIDGLLDRPIQFEPGTDWKYISENAFLLSWILQKETGMTVTDYLTPRLYEALDIEVPDWEKNQDGVDAGGWGLKLTADDIAKISILYLNKGVYNGKRVFSENWYNLATYPYTKKTYPVFTDKTEYGYQIWIDHENDDTTYRFTGLYGQFVFIFPEHDASIIITASDNRDYEYIHAVYNHFPNGFIEEENKADDKKVADWQRLTESMVIAPNFANPTIRNTEKEKEIGGRLIKFASRSVLSTQGVTTYFMWIHKIGHLNDVKFDFSPEGLAFSFQESSSERTVINCGMNGEYVRNYILLGGNQIIVDAQAAWNKDGTLELFIYDTGRPQSKRFTFSFKHNLIKMETRTDPGYGDVAKFNIQFNMGMNVGPKFESVIRTFEPVFNAVYADPNIYGHFIGR